MVPPETRPLWLACAAVLYFSFVHGLAMVPSGVGLVACGYLYSATYRRS